MKFAQELFGTMVHGETQGAPMDVAASEQMAAGQVQQSPAPMVCACALAANSETARRMANRFVMASPSW